MKLDVAILFDIENACNVSRLLPDIANIMKGET